MFVDPSHSEAIKTFIELTHDRYTKSLGEDFGHTVKGMFTDEMGLLGKFLGPLSCLIFKETKGFDLKGNLYALIDDMEKSSLMNLLSKLQYNQLKLLKHNYLL